MRRLLMLRHGESEWNAAGRWQGWEDVCLTASGEAQALARARLLAVAGDFAAVVASDLVRAARTAEVVATHLGLSAPVLYPGLRERHGGEWQGHTGAEIDEGWPGMRDAWRRGEMHSPPGGESDASVLARVDAALASACAAVADGAALVAVTHGGVLRLVSARAGVSPNSLMPNLGGRWFTFDSDGLHAGGALPPLPEPLEETPDTE